MACTPKWKRLRWSHEHWNWSDCPAKTRRKRWVRRFCRNQPKIVAQVHAIFKRDHPNVHIYV